MLQSNTNLIYYSEAWCAGPKLDSRPAYWSTRAVAASQVSRVSTGLLFLRAWCWELAPILDQHSHKAHMHTVRWEVTCWNFLTTLSILPSKQLVLWASSSAKRVAWDISEWSGSQTSGIAAVQCTVKYINIYAVVWPLKSIVLVQKWYMYQKQSHSLKLFYGACPPDPP